MRSQIKPKNQWLQLVDWLPEAPWWIWNHMSKVYPLTEALARENLLKYFSISLSESACDPPESCTNSCKHYTEFNFWFRTKNATKENRENKTEPYSWIDISFDSDGDAVYYIEFGGKLYCDSFGSTRRFQSGSPFLKDFVKGIKEAIEFNEIQPTTEKGSS